jgi:hypothetical protein
MDLFSNPEPAEPLSRGAAPAPTNDPFAPPPQQPHPEGRTETADPAARADTAA